MIEGNSEPKGNDEEDADERFFLHSESSGQLSTQVFTS
jgi:hypothetical protein